MSMHIVEVQQLSRVKYMAVCSCGKYRSAVFGFIGHAEHAGDDHVKAKAAATRYVKRGAAK